MVARLPPQAGIGSESLRQSKNWPIAEKRRVRPISGQSSMYPGAMKDDDIYDDILYVEEEEGVAAGMDESRLPVAPRPFRTDDRGGGGESSDEDGSSEGYPDEEDDDDDEELDEDEYDSDVDDLGEEDSLISAWDRGLGLTRGGLGIRGGFGGARQDFLELSHSCIKEGGGLTTEFSFDVTPGRRRSTLHQTFTQSLLEETKQRQRQRDNFERERLRRAVFILQRGSSLKKKTEHEKTYKDRFLFLSNDLQSLSLAKSSQTRHKAKVSRCAISPSLPPSLPSSLPSSLYERAISHP